MIFKNNDRKIEKFKLITVLLLALYYVGIAVIDGPVWCVDTESYVAMDFSREPVYPLFLLILRSLFEMLHITGKLYNLPAYLTMAVFLQSILWIWATSYLGFYILDINNYIGEKKAKFISVMAMLLQVSVAGINRFVANRGSMYSESLMTESLAMPLYVIFTVELVKSFEKYDRKSLLKLFILSILICSIRKQMLVVLVTWGLSSFVIHLFVKKHRDLKKFLLTCILVTLSYMSITIVDCSYNYFIRGVFSAHTGNSKGGFDTLLYTATADDAKLFINADYEEFPDIENVFLNIYSTCQSKELTIDYAPGYELKEKSNIFNSDWVDMASHYADSYDVIGFDVVLPILEKYVNDYFPELDYVQSRIKQDQVETYLFKTLMKQRFIDIINGNDRGVIYVLSANVIKAFIISNANMSPRILIPISGLIYVAFVIVFFTLCFLKKPSIRGCIIRMMFIVALGIFVNCLVTGSMIFPQPRYMCYGMGLFYFVALWGIGIQLLEGAEHEVK